MRRGESHLVRQLPGRLEVGMWHAEIRARRRLGLRIGGAGVIQQLLILERGGGEVVMNRHHFSVLAAIAKL
jgi:hypothetical protein